MRFQLVEKVRALLHPHVEIAMKAHEFEYGCDDLGQYEGDVEGQVPAPPAATAPAGDAKVLH